MSNMKDKRISLKETQDVNERRAHLWGMILVVGLALEVAIALAFSNGKSPMEIVVATSTALLVAVSVGLEIHFGKKAGRASAELQRILDEQIAEAEARAAEANLKAEQEKTARLKIEEMLAPRIIGREQKNSMVEELKKFAGTEFTASVFQDPEAIVLLHSLLEVFKNAGWVLCPPKTMFVIPTGYGMIGTTLSTGVILRAPDSLERKALEASVAFRFSGLKKFAVAVSAPEVFGERIHLEVGKKDTITDAILRAIQQQETSSDAPTQCQERGTEVR